MKKSHEDSWMASFHVRVCHDDYAKLQSPATWPVGLKCSDFIRRRPARLKADSNQGGQAQVALLQVGQILQVLQGAQRNQNIQNGE